METSLNSGSSTKRKRRNSGVSRRVVTEANKILVAVRARALYLTPFRLLSHLPCHGALVRPVDTLRVNLIGAGMGASGFRLHEPCCINDPMLDINIPRFILGGNHRQASTRDSGQVLVPANRVTKKQMQDLMHLMTEEDQHLIDSGHLTEHFSEHDQAMRCLKILSITIQGLEPSPTPLTCLQQVQLLRTAYENDPMLKSPEEAPKFLSKARALKERVFGPHPGSSDSSVHFLLNKGIGDRHRNKLLAGAKALIMAKSSFSLLHLGKRQSVLDILAHWESKSLMGPFLETHLSYIGPMSSRAINSIMEKAQVDIQSGIYTTCPFNTAVSGRKAHRPPGQVRDDNGPGVAPPSRPAHASVSRNPSSADYAHPKRKRGPPERLLPQADPQDLPPLPKSRRVGKSSKTKTLPVSGSHIPAETSLRLEKEKNRADEQERRAAELHKQLKEAERIRKKDIQDALEKERENARKKHSEHIQNLLDEHRRNSDHVHQKTLQDLRQELDMMKEQVLSAENAKQESEVYLKEEMTSKLNEQRQRILLAAEAESKTLRAQLQELQKRSLPDNAMTTDDPRWKKMVKDNERLRKELEVFKNADSRVRRMPRSVIPSDKTLSAMSRETLKQLKSKIEKTLSSM